MRNNAEKPIIVLFAAIVALLAGTTIAAWRNINRSVLSSDWVNHTHAVISEAEGISSSIDAAERALRDFVLTANERDRALCRRYFAEAVEHLAAGQGLTRGEPAQNSGFLQIEALVAKRVDFAQSVIKTQTDTGLDSARKLISADRDVTSEIHSGVERLKSEEESLLRERDKDSYLQAQNTRWIVFVGAAINVGILIFMVYLVRDDISARRRVNQSLEESNRKLDARVEERTRELADVNKALEQQNLEERWSNQALDHQLRYNQLIINSIDTLVLVISKASNITRINPAVTRRTGFEPWELVGQPLRHVMSHSDSGGKGTDLVGACMREGRDLTNSPGLLHGKDAEKTSISFSVFPVRDQDKIVGGVITINLV